ncbi:hypothetical protein TRFO_00931 [Tritrichomonas foetus]|uniref:Uncharacterized protein n=1 Tax=Tritrichomonas foetus TaxID=1144522 RepID=A0A1J4L2H6_9EUKA|nr:hypothetical protein TRFO_00931 [Tritrichomonas foetus]|eukprot:OHT17651.1 hypothetical protein TRFO_00931 [Tritrichomonas foetus]
MASVQELQAQLNEITEKYNKLLASTQEQNLQLQKIDKRKMVLHKMVEDAQLAKSDLVSKIQKLAEEENIKAKQMQEDADKLSKETNQKIIEISKIKDEYELLYKSLVLRRERLLEHWGYYEKDYLMQIDELDAKCTLMYAKYREVSHRISILSEAKKNMSDDILTGLQTKLFSSFNLISPDEKQILEFIHNNMDNFLDNPPFDTLNIEEEEEEEILEEAETIELIPNFPILMTTEEKKRQLEELKLECRSLQEERDRLLATKSSSS